MRISAASFAYPDCKESVRAQLAKSLSRQKAFGGAYVLPTCLRIEVAVEGGPDQLRQVLGSLFDGDVFGAGVVRHDEDAVLHLYRVAAGLESPVIGEVEILTQFRHALRTSEDAGGMGGLFIKLIESAVAVGKQARQLLPDIPHSSLAAVTAQVIGLADRVAVFGSGVMATSVINGLSRLPVPPAITVVARSPEKVAIPGIEVWGFERAVQAIEEFPALVSATSAKKRLVDTETFAAALTNRTEKLLLVDMAMPPDFDPPPGAQVSYVSIDDLARLAARRPRQHDADVFVASEAAGIYRKMVDHSAVGPVIAEIMRSADEVVERAVERFATKLGNGNDPAVLRQAAHTVARSLLSSPVSYLRSGDESGTNTRVIASAFGLGDG